MQNRILKISLAVIALTFAAIMAVDADAQPKNIVAVYRQSRALMPVWASRGVTVAFGYEPENDANGNASVTMDQWKVACRASGIYYICEPSTNLAADAADPFQLGWLQWLDEPDGKVVTQSDAGSAPGMEAIYQSLESIAAACRAASPTKDIWVNLDGNQVRYKQGVVNYARIIAASTKQSVDFYPVQRGEPISNYGAILDQAKAIAGNHLQLAFVECSNQNLSPLYYPGQRPPTPTEMLQEAGLLTARNLNLGWFPQQLPQPAPPAGNGIGFLWDATPASLLPTMLAIDGVGSTPTVPAVPPPAVVAPIVVAPATQPTTQPALSTPTLSISVSIPGYPAATVTISPSK